MVSTVAMVLGIVIVISKDDDNNCDGMIMVVLGVAVAVVVLIIMDNISESSILNLSHSNITMHILHTVLYTFLKVQTKRICITIKGFFSY